MNRMLSVNDTEQNYPAISYNFNVASLKNGAEKGYCRICGKFAELTVDHIPPKSCGNKGRTSFTVGNKSVIMQNGFHCRTICAECNNTLLGANLDKDFKKFYDEVKFAKSSPALTKQGLLEIKVDPQKVLRCILAHFLAANVCHRKLSVKGVLNSPLDTDIIYERYRQFVLGNTTVLENTNVYYWYYPYSNIVINPYFGCMTDAFTPQKHNLVGTLIKFFPIGLFILNKDSSDGIPHGSLFNYQSESLVLNMTNIEHKKYLEVPLSTEALLLDSHAVVNGNKADKD